MLTEASGEPGEPGRTSPLSSYSSGRESMVRRWGSLAPGLREAGASAAETLLRGRPLPPRLPDPRPAQCTPQPSDSAPRPGLEARLARLRLPLSFAAWALRAAGPRAAFRHS